MNAPVFGPALGLALLLALPSLGTAAQPPADPLDSPQWSTMHHLFFQDAPVVFDERVRVLLPPEAEDSLNVPVAVDYSAFPDAEEVLLFVDFNPIPKALEYYPGDNGPFLGTRLRVQQATPVRAAVRTPDGTWHVGGGWVDAAGGGCTLPDMEAAAIAEEEIGQVYGRVWTRPDGSKRLKVRVTHPNDTGLIMGAPAFYVEELHIHDGQGRELASLNTYEPLCESPIFSFDLPAGSEGPYRVSGRDNQGIEIEAEFGEVDS